MSNQFVIGRCTFIDVGPELSRLQVVCKVFQDAKPALKAYTPRKQGASLEGYTDAKSVERRNICEC
jgi:hypothetical protein